MAHIHFMRGDAEQVINTDQIVTATRSMVGVSGQEKARVEITTALTDWQVILLGTPADEFWEKYQRTCVASQRPEVG